MLRKPKIQRNIFFFDTTSINKISKTFSQKATKNEFRKIKSKNASF